MALTKRQKEVLDFIKEFILERGFPPSVREVGERFGIYPRAVFDHIRALERKGYVRRSPAKSRGIEVLDFIEKAAPSDIRLVPLVGRVSAGGPTLALENIEETVPIARDWARGEEVFFLRVKGDSMAPFILDRDFVLVRTQQSADQGDAVVALLGDEATVKWFAREGRSVILKPENPKWEVLRIREGTRRFRILGKVIGVYRRL